MEFKIKKKIKITLTFRPKAWQVTRLGAKCRMDPSRPKIISSENPLELAQIWKFWFQQSPTGGSKMVFSYLDFHFPCHPIQKINRLIYNCLMIKIFTTAHTLYMSNV